MIIMCDKVKALSHFLLVGRKEFFIKYEKEYINIFISFNSYVFQWL